MAKFLATDVKVKVNNVDLSDHADSVDTPEESEQVDVSGFSPTRTREFLAGLSDQTIEVEFLQDFASSKVHATLQPLYYSGTTFPIFVQPDSDAGTSATNPIFGGTAVLFSYNGLGRIAQRAGQDHGDLQAGPSIGSVAMARKSYPTDLTPRQVEIVSPLLPTYTTGRSRTWSCVEILNAIFYLVSSGAAWRLMPHDFPPWQTVYSHFRTWKLCGLGQEVNDQLLEQTRIQEGRSPLPSAAVIDSQSVKMPDKGQNRGYDAGKKVTGRKRHILVDVLGLVLAVVVHSAGIQDRDGAKLVLDRTRGRPIDNP